MTSSAVTNEVRPFQSLDELLKAHHELLQMSEGESSAEDDHARTMSPRVLEAIRHFLKRAAAAGVVLDASTERKQAQGTMDYWSATIYTEARNVGERLTPEETILEPFDSSRVSQAIQKADHYLDQASAEQRQIAERILVRLTRLNAAGQAFEQEHVALNDLSLYGEPAEVQFVLDRLEAAGVIRRITRSKETGADAEEAAVEITLSSESLIRHWPRLQEWLSERKGLRNAALLWRDNRKDPAALLTDGPLLERALSYRNLGDLEQEFADASRRRREGDRKERDRIRRIAIGILSIKLVLVVTLAAVAWSKSRSLERANEILSDERVVLESTNQALESKQEKLDLANRELREANRELKLAIEAIEQNNRLLAGSNKAAAESGQAVIEEKGKRQDLAEELLPLIERILDDKEKFYTHLPMPLQTNLREYRSELNAIVKANPIQPVKFPIPGIHLYPGCQITVGQSGEGKASGTASGLFVDPEGKGYLIGPRFLFTAPIHTGWGPPEGPDKVVAIPVPLLAKGKIPDEFSLAAIQPDVRVTNLLPDKKPILSVLESVPEGTAVVLWGYRDGKKNGIVKEVTEEYLITDRISVSGDAGAPVLVEGPNGYQLVGILIGFRIGNGGKEESLIKRAAPYLKEQNLKLWSEPNATWTANPT